MQVVVAAPGAGGSAVANPAPAAVVPAAGAGDRDAVSALAGQPSSDSQATPSPQSASESSLPGGLWPWLVVLGMGLGWLATLVLFVLERRRGLDRAAGAGLDASPVRPASLQKARRAFDSACLKGDPRAARSALMDWGRARWGRDAPTGLAELAARLGGDEVRACLDGIDRAIYAPGDRSWDGPAAGRLLRGVLERSAPGNASRDAEALPGLYPRRLCPGRA